MKALFTLHGVVQHGAKRGKRLGFPTMNAPVERDVPEGIYVSHVSINDTLYNALTFIGIARTFNQTDYLAETYLLDFSDDIYGSEFKVDLLKKIRDNKTFETEEELVKQMKEDRRQAIIFFKK